MLQLMCLDTREQCVEATVNLYCITPGSASRQLLICIVLLWAIVISASHAASRGASFASPQS